MRHEYCQLNDASRAEYMILTKNRHKTAFVHNYLANLSAVLDIAFSTIFLNLVDCCLNAHH